MFCNQSIPGRFLSPTSITLSLGNLHANLRIWLLSSISLLSQSVLLVADFLPLIELADCVFHSLGGVYPTQEFSFGTFI